MTWLLQLLGVDPVGKIVDGLNRAHEARLAAKNDSDRIAADMTIAQLNALLEQRRLQAGVIQEGMKHRAFWFPWLLAALPLSGWFAWGVMDSMLNGALPDVATLPPQLKEYADAVWQNIFYTGAGVAGAGALASAIRGRK